MDIYFFLLQINPSNRKAKQRAQWFGVGMSKEHGSVLSVQLKEDSCLKPAAGLAHHLHSLVVSCGSDSGNVFLLKFLIKLTLLWGVEKNLKCGNLFFDRLLCYVFIMMSSGRKVAEAVNKIV